MTISTCYACDFRQTDESSDLFTWTSVEPLPESHPTIIRLCDRCAGDMPKLGITLTLAR